MFIGSHITPTFYSDSESPSCRRPPTSPRAMGMGITVTSAMASHSLPLLGSWFADDDDLKTPSPLLSLFSAINMTIIGGLVCAARDKLDDVRRMRRCGAAEGVRLSILTALCEERREVLFRVPLDTSEGNIQI